MAKKIKTASPYLLILILVALMVTFNFYSSRVMAQEPVTTTVNLLNVVPTMGAVYVQGTGVTEVTITEDSYMDIMATVSITDNNGCTDIRDGGGVEAIFYTTDHHWTFGVATPTFDYNDFLTDAVTSCQFESCSGDTATYHCFASDSWYYYADPTVGSTATKAQEDWAVMVWASDSYDAYVSSSSMDVAAGASNSAEVTLVSAIALEAGSQSVAYSNDTDNTDSDIEERGMRNSGNRGINPQIISTILLTSGGDTIPAQSQLFASSSFSFPWDSDAYGVSLSESYQELDLDLPQRTDDNDEVDDQIFWGLHVPINTVAGNYSGTNSYNAVPD